MPYYPSSFPSKANRSGNGPLRVLGALLSLTSMILAALGIFFHQSTLGLMISVIVALFGLRVFILWLGARAPSVTLASSPTASTRPPVYPTSTFNQEQEPALHTRPLAPIGAGLSLPTRAGASPAPTIHEPDELLRRMVGIPLAGILGWGRVAFTNQETPSSSARNSSSLSLICAAAISSSRCLTEEVPGMGNITRERRSNQASAI